MCPRPKAYRFCRCVCVELEAPSPAESGCILSLFLINIGVSCNLSPRVQHSLSVSVLLAFVRILSPCARSLVSGGRSG